jgi:hypothetical protein
LSIELYINAKDIIVLNNIANKLLAISFSLPNVDHAAIQKLS